jgi:hypothetical protein
MLVKSLYTALKDKYLNMQCSACQQEKDEETFVKNRLLCKDCNCSKVRAHYQKNALYRISSKERAEKRKQRKSKVINEFKTIYGCYFCAESDPCCLQFHHIDPHTKKFEIHGGSNRNMDNYKTEILKCEILCSNCHIKVHRNKLVISSRRMFDLDLLIN